MKIFLVNAFYSGMYGYLKSAAGRFFPLGLGYIASALIDKGHEVRIIDPETQNLNFSELSDIFLKEKPEIVGISCATPSFNYARKISRIVKENSSAITILGGTHPSALPDYIIKNYQEIDLVCIGEGEITMCEVADALYKNISWENVPGLCFKQDGFVRFSTARPYISDIDTIKMPARHLLDLNKYFPNAHYYRHKRSATMITSRGCPYGCIFCASFTTLGKKFRAHSVQYVLQEIEYLYYTYGIRYIIFNDDTFTIDKKRTIEICSEIIKRKLDIEWYCFARVDTIDYELLSIMKESGCKTIGFGVESADPIVLKNIRKNISVEQVKTAFSFANVLKLKTLAFFIFGCPGESKDTIIKTIEFSKIINPTLAFFNILTPYPGTPIFKEYYNLSNNSYNWDNFVTIGLNPVNINKGLSISELNKYLYIANKSFYMRPLQIVKIISHITSLFELWMLIKASIGLLLQNLKRKKSK